MSTDAKTQGLSTTVEMAIWLIILLFGLGIIYCCNKDKVPEIPKVKQEVIFMSYDSDDVPIFALTTSYRDITHNDYGNAKTIDSLKCIRYNEMKMIVGLLDEINEPCEK